MTTTKNIETHFELEKGEKSSNHFVRLHSWRHEENIPGFDPANVREKLPDDSSGILTPSSISSTIRERTGIG